MGSDIRFAMTVSTKVIAPMVSHARSLNSLYIRLWPDLFKCTMGLKSSAHISVCFWTAQCTHASILIKSWYYFVCSSLLISSKIIWGLHKYFAGLKANDYLVRAECIEQLYEHEKNRRCINIWRTVISLQQHLSSANRCLHWLWSGIFLLLYFHHSTTFKSSSWRRCKRYL